MDDGHTAERRRAHRSPPPGGGVFTSQVRTNGARDIPGLGESAFIDADGDLNVIAAEGWVQVGALGATDDQLVALARVVLTNNGYTQD